MADGGYSGVIAGTPSYQQGKVVRLAVRQKTWPHESGARGDLLYRLINDLPSVPCKTMSDWLTRVRS